MLHHWPSTEQWTYQGGVTLPPSVQDKEIHQVVKFLSPIPREQNLQKSFTQDIMKQPHLVFNIVSNVYTKCSDLP